MFKIIDKIVGFINQSIATIGITAGIAVAFTNVVARYVFDASFVWASELSIYLFLWSAFFGAAYCFKKDAHIAVTIILDIVPTPIAKIMLILSHAITLGFLAAVSYYGYEYLLLVIDLDERSIDLWDMPMWIIYLVVPVSFGLASYRVLEKLIITIKTPHEDCVLVSEADHVLAELNSNKNVKENDNVQNLEKIVKDAEKKTGGML
ncbi:MAG: C4-dicarboxylate TRAP transporter small permease protein DctQ [Arcobacter lacus]|nr:MAG: C4-dicarboxylate TRAP transporter small permease protein DctQ [Arcobacter lacus]